MRYLLVLAFATVSLAGTVLPNQNEISYSIEGEEIDAFDLEENDGEFELVFDEEDGSSKNRMQRGKILTWEARRKLRKVGKQMPCGWPQYGIPPLAPLKVREAQISLKKGILETNSKVLRFRIDGLDGMRMKKLKLNLLKHYTTFDFIFRNIKISADKYETNTILNAMQQYGLYVQYEGDGSLEFVLQNVRVIGRANYKLPIFWGSAKITSLKINIAVEKCISNSTGFMGGGEVINNFINSQIEHIVETEINDTNKISDLIEQYVVTEVNKNLKGRDFWTLIDYIFSSKENEDDPIVSNCVPPADPWA